ncbi:hypothetical protein CAEBREN_01159 [Caenorhabditis brenneri]|uniref:Uncharacterized protein n=1 Tax=Caenorhabditis brenneri TaxID=135651 RepID=G0MWX4_CAEBE|nr:hypothetical protein CAEBREN_01159 [Caenorhabditis brenneri]
MYENTKNPTTKKNSHTKFKRIPFSHYEARVEPDYPVHFINNVRFMGNFCLLNMLKQSKSDMEKNKYFVMDAQDEERWRAEKVKPLFFLERLEHFMTKYPDKVLYIRYIKHNDKEYFFADDVLEILPLALKKQGTPMSLFDKRIHKLKEKYESNCCNQTTIIPLKVFEKILDMYDVDRSWITIIPDYEFVFRKTLHYNHINQHISHAHLSFAEMLLPKQAVYYVFWKVVCEVNWNMNYCVEHPRCRLDCVELIVEVMRQLLDWGEDKMITLKYVNNLTCQLMHTCHMQRVFEEQNDDSDHLFPNRDPGDTVPFDSYLWVVQTFGLHPGNLNEYGENPLGYRIWLVRGLLMSGWIQSFFRESENCDLKKVIFDEMCSIMPHGNTEVVTNGLRRIAFAPYNEKWNKIKNATETKKLKKLAADRERRNQQIQEKRQKSKNKETPKMKEEKPKAVAVKVETKTVKNDEQKGWKDYSEEKGLKLKNGIITIGSHYFTSNQNIQQLEGLGLQSPDCRHYFLLDWTQWTTKFAALKSASKNCSLDTLKIYSNHFKDFVVRAIKTTTGNYVLTCEMLVLIMVLMEKDEISMEQYHEKLKTYIMNWSAEDPEVFYAVEVSFFEVIMDSFNVNRDLLTIVPDYSHYKSSNEPDTHIVTTEISGGKRVMSKEQAVFNIFQSVICGVNWETKSCKKNKTIVDDFKQKYHEETGKLMKMRKGTFVSQQLVDNSIAVLLAHPVFTKKIVHPTVDFEFIGLDSHAIIPREVYTKQADFFVIPRYNYSHNNEDVEIWLARSWLRMGWIESFYEVEMVETKLMLMQELRYQIPVDLREDLLQGLRKTVFLRAGHIEEENNWRGTEELKKLVSNPTVLKKLQKTEKPVEPKKLNPPPLESTMRSLEISENSENTRPTSTPVLEPAKSSEPAEPTVPQNPPQKPPQKPKKAPKAPKPCTKCTENGVALLNAREKLKKTEIVAKHNVTKARKAGKVEENLKNMMLKMNELEEEIGNLNGELKDFDVQEEKIRKENKKVLKDIGNLEEQVEREEQKSQEANQRNIKIRNRFEEVQLELVKKQSEQEAMELQRKRTRNPAPFTSSEEPSTFHVPFIPSLPTTDDPELARNPQWVLEQWRKMRTDFKNDEMVEEEREMIEKLLSKSEDLELDVRNLVENEQYQFEATCRVYLQNIDLNIMKIEKTEDISNLRPLAKYPSLSKEFQSVYEKYMGNNI